MKFLLQTPAPARASLFVLLILADLPENTLSLQSVLADHFPEWHCYFVYSTEELSTVLSNRITIPVFLLDKNLSDEQTMATVKQIRQHQLYTSVPILGFSSNFTQLTSQSLALGGTVAFFPRPTTVRSMIGILRMLPVFGSLTQSTTLEKQND